MKIYNREQNKRVTLIKFVKIWRHEGVLDILNTVQEFIRQSLRLDVSRGHNALGTYVENDLLKLSKILVIKFIVISQALFLRFSGIPPTPVSYRPKKSLSFQLF